MVKEFMAFTQASEKAAIKCLTAVDWSVERAADHFYTSGAAYQADGYIPSAYIFICVPLSYLACIGLTVHFATCGTTICHMSWIFRNQIE